jgi:[acyl-carrier-protein] S-malonyltransferase
MGRDVAEASPAAREVFQAADQALGFSLSQLCFEGPEDELRRTEVQQPAILTTSIALLRALEERTGVTPDFVGGHSLGEYTALVSAGALCFEDAVRLVHARGRFMQEAVTDGKGAMAAIMGCGPDDVRRACDHVQRSTDMVVTPANFNSPQQTVIAGDAVAVELACTKARDFGAKRAVPLQVSAPFHCPLMQPAADKLELELSRVRFSEAVPPVISNVEAMPNADAKRMRSLLTEQVTSPVRFTDMVVKLRELGVDRFLEVGPGRVLFGLLARIERRLTRASFGGMDDFEAAVEFAEGRAS